MLESLRTQKETITPRGMHIGWPKFVIAVVALAIGGTAAALGFGAIRSNVTLGQPLSLAVPVQLAEGETLSAHCASAEVVAGDMKLAPGAVHVRVTQGRDASESVLRITTSSAVEEPVLTVTVSAGCPARMTRTLVLLADPPLLSTDNVVLAPPPSPPLVTATAEPVAAPPQTTPGPSVTAAPVARQPSSPPPRQATRPPSPPRSTAAAVTTRAAAVKPKPIDAAAPPQAKAPPVRRAASAEPKSRLRLDAAQVSFDQAAVLAAQEQASAARAMASAAEAAASVAEQRLRAMETEMKLLRADAKAQAEALLQLRQQLARDQAQRDKPSTLTVLLLGIAAALAVLVVWLGWRLHAQAQAPRAEAWWDRAAVADADDEMAEFREPSRASAAMPRTAGPAPRATEGLSELSEQAGLDSMYAPPTVPAPTAVTIPPISARDAEMSRAMSVDEQIDLEQQADFFIALGHDEAAIDLLMAHLRSTGGGSPLPFLKLLEIHRRRGQHEAYERTRIRFNQRFNGVAPEWDADPQAGRTLEDYPKALKRVQATWATPLDAMVELEAMLFRRGTGAESFDLPAYQDVLFLYQMARDLNQLGAAGAASDVDVLLPMGGVSQEAAPRADDGTIQLRPEFNLGQPLELNLGGNAGRADGGDRQGSDQDGGRSDR